jgi:hypothetical protein
MQESVFQKIRGKTFHLLSSLALLISFAALGASAQSVENLNPSQATAVSVGRGRPIVESVGPSRNVLEKERLIEKYRFELASIDSKILAGESAAADIEALAEEAGHNVVNVVARHPDGSVFKSESTFNLRTDAGDNWQSELMGKDSTPTVNLQAYFIGLTNTAITPAASDTSLSGEITSNGLSRAAGTYAHSANSSTYTIAKTFTASGAQSAQASALFTDVTVGSDTMPFIATFTQVTLATNDTVTVTWTINF